MKTTFITDINKLNLKSIQKLPGWLLQENWTRKPMRFLTS